VSLALFSHSKIQAANTRGHVSHILPPNSETCFYCDRKIALGWAVQWQGTTAIFLHPGCAVEFTIRIMRDIHDIECRGGTIVAPNAGEDAIR